MMDVRSKKSIPVAQSEDQEDELLSIVSIKRLEILPILLMIDLNLNLVLQRQW